MTQAKPQSKTKVAGVWASAIAVVLARAYMLMLALGILHLQWTHSIPPLGLWECVALSTAFAMVKR